MTAPDPTPAADLKTSIEAGDDVRLIVHAHRFTSTPETVMGEASSTGKTVSVPGDDVRDARTLDSDDIAELEAGGWVYRDSYRYGLHTPHRFAAVCQNLENSDPFGYRGPTPDPAEVREWDTATHAPERGSVYGPGGREAPPEWDDADGGDAQGAQGDATGAQGGSSSGPVVATDGGDGDGWRHDMTEWLPANGGMESSAGSGDGSAYIAEVAGEHAKYGVDREFVTDKQDGGKRVLKPAEVFVGTPYEIQHCGAEAERTYQYVTAVETDDNGELVGIETDELASADEALESLAWDDDPERARLLDEIETATQQMSTDELRTTATRMGVGTQQQDPADIAQVNPAEIPGAAGERVGAMRKAFVAAFERRFGASPDAETRAAVIDAAVLVEKRRDD